MDSVNKELKEYVKNALEIYHYLKSPGLIVPFLPNTLYIEPTNICNLNCIICARKNMKRKLGFMSLDNFKKVIDILVAEDFRPPLTLTNHGEPLMHKDIFAMIKYAKDKSFNVSIISNSTLLTDENIRKLLESGLDRYQTCFDSVDKEEYEKMRKGASYEDTKNKIIKLIDKNEKNGHKVYISVGLIKTSVNQKNIQKTKDFWESKKIDNIYLGPLLSFQVDSGFYKEAMSIVDSSIHKTCVVPWTAMTITHDCDVRSCTADFNSRYILGNILKENSIRKLWNNEKVQRLRKATIENDTHFFSNNCHDCNKCNTPYVGNSTQDYLEEFPVKIIKKIGIFHSKPSGEL